MADEKPSGIDGLLKTARDRYKRAIDADKENREHALEVLKFRNLEQWDPAIKNARERDPEGARPCTVVDKTNQFLRQVCNDERQNRPAIKVRPVDDNGDPEVADVYQGLIRNIEDQSGADIAYDTSFEHAADGGFGYIRVVSEYCDDMSFDQDLRIKRVRNRFQVVMDPDRQEPDGSDSKFAFVVEKMLRTDYEEQYKEHPVDFDADGKVYPEWVEKDHVLVAEYWRIESEQKTLVMWADGSTSIEGEMPKVAGLAPMLREGKPVTRKTTVKKVKWSKINGKEELEKRDWPGKWIPIVEVIGNELDIEGKSVKCGLYKPAMEPQRIHNYAAASFIENVALAPKAPWVAAQGQVEGIEHDWRTANRRNLALLTYKPLLMDGQVPVPPPQRASPPGIPVGWQQTLQNTEHDIQASMGMYNASLGAESNEKSGIALQKKQREADTATFHYSDNLSRSIRHVGRILLDLIPHYYDTERVARILGEDGEPRMAKLNPDQDQAVVEQPTQEGKVEKIYNLNVGKYDVTASAGPSFTTKRQEAAEFMSNVAAAAKDPATVQVATYLAVKNSDMAGAEEAVRMIKKMLPPGLVEPEEGEEEVPMVNTPQGPIPLPAAEQMIGQLMQQAEQAEEAMKKAGDLQQMEQHVKDEATKVDAERAGLEAIRAAIESAKRELALEEELAIEKIRGERLQAEKELMQLQNPEAIAQNAAKQAVDGVMEMPIPQ
ncbi:MAG: portal protein [Gemmatimonadales bacterium]